MDGDTLDDATRSVPVPAAGDEPGAGDVIGRYVLRELLGEGGFGCVWLADQSTPVRRRVALKLLKAGMDTAQVVARFETERQALAMMDHPNIARVYDAGVAPQGRSYFVMELVDGVPITQYAREHALDARARLQLLRTASLAVQHAHQRGIIHRDIKPTNVLVAEVDGEPQPKVIDFGVAKALERDAFGSTTQTVEGLVVGTPVFMSPEQIRGRPDVDTRADVYSLGVLAYQLLSGALPFEESTWRAGGVDELRRLVCEVDPPTPSSRLRAGGASTGGVDAPRLPRELDWIVMRCLEKDPARRYPTASALAEDLRRHLDGQPVEAAPPSRAYRLRKLVARHRVATAAVVAVLLSLVLGSIGTTLGMLRAERSNERLDVALRQLTDVNDFLTEDLLGAVRPSAAAGAGHDVRMSEVLDAAAARIEAASAPGGRFADAPEVEASIRAAIGASYAALGRDEEALAHLERAQALHEQTLGPRGPQTLIALALTERSRFYADDAATVERHLRAALPDLVEVLGPAHTRTIESHAVLGQALWRLGRHDEAASVLEETLRLGRDAVGDENRRLLNVKSALAMVETERGRPERAEPLFREVLERRLALDGPDDPASLTARRHLGTFLLSQRRLDEARPILEASLEQERRIMGPEHPNTLADMLNFGAMLLELGEAEVALRMVEEVVAANRRHAPRHIDSVIALDTLSAVQAELGRTDEAEAAGREAHALALDVAGTAHPVTLQVRGRLARLLLATGGPAEARELLLASLPVLEERHGAGHERVVDTLSSLASAARALGDEDEALARLGDAVERSAPLPPGTSARLGARLDLADLHTEAGRPGAAEAVLLATHAELVEAYGTDHARVRAVATLLSGACDAQGRTEDAERWRAAATPASADDAPR